MDLKLMRFSCIYALDFSVQAVLRFDDAISFRKNAVAVVDGPESLRKVVCCNQKARTAGVEAGMTKLQAEACPGIVVRRRSMEQEGSAHAALLNCAHRFSPRVESTAPGTLILDLTGTERLLGPEKKIGLQLTSQAQSCGFAVNVAFAANPDTALHAARGFAGTTVIASGEEAARLGYLPIEVLQPSAEVLDTLNSWGIQDFKSLAKLPTMELTQRLGQHGLQLQRLARGEVQRELLPAALITSFEETIELEETVELLEPLAFLLNRLLEQVMARLMTRSLATDHLELKLYLEVHPDRQLKAALVSDTEEALHERTLKLPVPTQDAKVLLKLLQLDLEAHPPQAPVRKIKVQAFPAHVRVGQAGLFQPNAPEPAKLEITMARLRAIVGGKDEEGRNLVGFPMVLDSHKPDSFEVMASSPPGAKATAKPAPVTRLALRRFRPPIRARVELKRNTPAGMNFAGTKARIRYAAGPWRNTGAWWDPNHEWQRDEWDIEVQTKAGLAVYRVFKDLRSGEWFVEGMYD